MGADLETQVRALAERQEAQEKRIALLEGYAMRTTAVCLDIQRDLRAGLLVLGEQMKELAESLEVVRRQAVAE